MRISLLLGFLGTAVTSLPTNEREFVDAGRGKIPIGRACTGVGLAETCTTLTMTTPNECVTAVSKELPLDRCIMSLEITARQPCAFFSLEACINPAGTHAMVVQGPARLPTLPGAMQDAIQAYICGPNATNFAPNATMAAGTVVVNIPKHVRNVEVKERDDEGTIPDDGRGATIFKQQDLIGETVPADKTAIPGNAWCTDLTMIYGNWDGRVRSLVVQLGYKCQFYTTYGCPSSSPKLSLGSKDESTKLRTLSEEFDEKIHSVVCVKI
ncbi:uncharacterized protein BDR25DRAFT_312786 [Lindgomyces ingoldianus]|uniref:Uncharacterized protein n=1 Tax=Lindgomyces ingoldianus TaxID=673940 RepID=A0ACB6R261_9PLEO|nr:uncharacterized protein BDR25DRAFT_312786 [Lindgomyces ingoldianus]KAF2472913.1 hypothetical protein BDR25DRAFT_312786 [Lindgomyces ingoldianus]